MWVVVLLIISWKKIYATTSYGLSTQFIQQCCQIILLSFWLFDSFSSSSNWNNFPKTFQWCQNLICNNTRLLFLILRNRLCVIFCHYSQLNKGPSDIFRHRQWCLNNKQSRFFTSYVNRKHSSVANYCYVHGRSWVEVWFWYHSFGFDKLQPVELMHCSLMTILPVFNTNQVLVLTTFSLFKNNRRIDWDWDGKYSNAFKQSCTCITTVSRPSH